MNTAAKALAYYMSGLSQDAYCAGWMDDLEFDLWHAVVEGPLRYGCLDLTREYIQHLSTLSQACGGWIMWRGGQEFVSLSEWQSVYIAYDRPFDNPIY